LSFQLSLQVISLAFVTIAIHAIVAFNCGFEQEMLRTELTYMMQLLYFRSAACTKFIHWERLGIRNVTSLQPDIPDETLTVHRTFVIAVSYLGVNGLLAITSTLLLCKLLPKKVKQL